MHFEAVAKIMLLHHTFIIYFASNVWCHKLLRRRLYQARGVSSKARNLPEVSSRVAASICKSSKSIQRSLMNVKETSKWTYLANDTVDGVRNVGESLLEAEELSGFVALGGPDRTR